MWSSEIRCEIQQLFRTLCGGGNGRERERERETETDSPAFLPRHTHARLFFHAFFFFCFFCFYSLTAERLAVGQRTRWSFVALLLCFYFLAFFALCSCSSRSCIHFVTNLLLTRSAIMPYSLTKLLGTLAKLTNRGKLPITVTRHVVTISLGWPRRNVDEGILRLFLVATIRRRSAERYRKIDRSLAHYRLLITASPCVDVIER